MLSKSSDIPQQGFTMLELIVVMAISGIIAAGATMQFSDVSSSFSRQNGLNQLEFDIRRARAHVVANGARGVLLVNGSDGSYSFGLDTLPYSVPPVADTQSFRRVLPTGVTVATATLVLNSRGFLIDPLTDAPTTGTLSLRFRDTEYCQLTVSTIGTVALACP